MYLYHGGVTGARNRYFNGDNASLNHMYLFPIVLRSTEREGEREREEIAIFIRRILAIYRLSSSVSFSISIIKNRNFMY